MKHAITAVFFLVLSALLAPAADAKMTLAEWNSAVLMAERRVAAACKIRDTMQADYKAAYDEVVRLEQKVEDLQFKAERGIVEAVQEELGLSIAVGTLIATGRLTTSTDVNVKAMINRRDAIFAKIGAFEEEALTPAKNWKNVMRDAAGTADRVKRRAVQALERLKRAKPVGNPTVDEENARKVAKIEAELEEINKELDQIDVSRYRYLTEVEEPNIDPTLRDEKPFRQKQRLTIAIATVDPQPLIFDDYRQRPLTRDSKHIAVHWDYPLTDIQSSIIKTFLTLELIHQLEKYRGHVNLTNGVVGPSSGKVYRTYFGAGVKFEWDLNDRFAVGVSPTIGALHTKMSGTFHASGTRPALKAAIYARYKVADNLFLVPSLQFIKPFGKINGGAGAAPPTSVDPGTIKSASLGFQFTF